MAGREMCITCKKIIPDLLWENVKTDEGHRICLACKNECGLDDQGLVYHQQCPNACTVEVTWEEAYVQDNHHPMA